MNEKILQYYDLIYKVMNDLHCRRDDETQDEMFFEGLMGLYRGIKTYKNETNTKELTYYYICIRNAIIVKFNYNTRAKRDKINTISIETPIYKGLTIADVIKDDVNLEKDLIETEQLELILKVLKESRNARFKQYICDYYGINTKKLRVKEIALKYGVTEHNVISSVRQGVQRLKKKVEKEYEKQNKKNNIKD